MALRVFLGSVLLSSFLFTVYTHTIPKNCQVLIVGAGIGGAYLAHRLSDASDFSPDQICVVEANDRPGGRILTVTGEVPGFEDYTVDLGAYRYRRAVHRMTANIAETLLGLKYRCYTDPFNIENGECFEDDLKLFTTRGYNFPIYPDGFNAADALQNFSRDIPYQIDEEAQWRAGYEPPSFRSPYEILDTFVTSQIPEVEDLEKETDYAKAMEIADVVNSKIRNLTYEGVPIIKLALWQLAVGEGMSMEELKLYSDVTTFPEFLFGSCLYFAIQDFRAIALSKAPLLGTPGLVVPMGTVKGVFRRIGMDNLVNGLLNLAKAKGVQVFYGHKATRVRQVKNSGGEMSVTFDNKQRVRTGTLFLNIPRSDLLSFGLTSEPMESGTSEFNTILSSVQRNQVSKMYCYWNDAWWVTKLNLTRGVFRLADETLYQGRYHDGDVQCDDPNSRTNCRGSLLVSYASGSTTGGDPGSPLQAYNPEFYWPFGEGDALRKLIPGNLTAHQQMHFDNIHAQLRRSHKKTFELAGLDVEQDLPDAEGCVYADWKEVALHVNFGAPLDAGTNSNQVFTAPVPGLNLSLVNENWNEFDGWAEGSLVSAERALFHVHGLAKPSWMDASYHESMIGKFNMGGP